VPGRCGVCDSPPSCPLLGTASAGWCPELCASPGTRHPNPRAAGGGRVGAFVDLSRVCDGALACSAGRRTRARVECPWAVVPCRGRCDVDRWRCALTPGVRGRAAWVVVGASPRSDAPGGESARPQGSSGRCACPVDERAPRVSFGGTSVFLADIRPRGSGGRCTCSADERVARVSFWRISTLRAANPRDWWRGRRRWWSMCARAGK
jgi:hypothetical protein